MEFAAPKVAERARILNTIAEKLKRQSKDDFKGLVANNFDVMKGVVRNCCLL